MAPFSTLSVLGSEGEQADAILSLCIHPSLFCGIVWLKFGHSLTGLTARSFSLHTQPTSPLFLPPTLNTPQGYEIPEAMTNVHRYLEAFKNSEVFEETKVEESEIEYGWRQHRML